MRSSGFLCAALFVACLFPVRGGAQDNDRAEPPLEPYHKHHDTRHGHDHYYPDRGAIVRNLPAGVTVVNYAGLSFRFQDGVWFEPRGPAFMVVSPPIGVIVPALPGFVTVLAHSGETYLYANDTYYRPRPDVGGYEVVNDPAETPPPDEAGSALHTPRVSGAPISAVPTSTAAVGNASTDDDGPPPVVTPLPDATATAAPVAKQPAVKAVATATPESAGSPPGAPASAVAVAKPSVAAPPVAASPAAAPSVVAPSVAAPPAAAIAVPTAPVTTAGPPRGAKVSLSPRNGQSADQEARDRYDCYRFAVTQTGFDPLRAYTLAGGVAQEYQRAQMACFEARGYSVQ